MWECLAGENAEGELLLSLQWPREIEATISIRDVEQVEVVPVTTHWETVLE